MAQPIRIYPNLLRAAIDAVRDILENKTLADTVVERTLRSDSRWGARDRRWVADEIYYILRQYRVLFALIGKTPDTLQDWYHVAAASQWLRNGEIPVSEHWVNISSADFEAHKAEALATRAIAESIPDWLDQLCAEQLGEELWSELLPALNQPAPLILRVNRLKKNLREVQEGLARQNVVATPVVGCLNALIVEGKPKLTDLDVFKKGWFEVQDTASQQISMLLQPLPNQTVIDTCAGAGGKTLHLAALMQNKGKIFALDVEEAKLQETERRATRAGATIIETRQVKTPLSYQDLIELADAVLIDAPCSGLGTLRRSLDIKWRLTPQRLVELRNMQAEILQNYSHFAKVGAKLVYATCSILPAENEKQVEAFLATPQGQKFKLVSSKNYYPHTDQTDGFFAALLERVK